MDKPDDIIVAEVEDVMALHADSSRRKSALFNHLDLPPVVGIVLKLVEGDLKEEQGGRVSGLARMGVAGEHAILPVADSC